ncbi:HEAT repeat-containing protein 2 [Irineochytrium annulatum]|nr:HEAT repeat-containing protein 2 [Irineochytrium annulatum]
MEGVSSTTAGDLPEELRAIYESIIQGLQRDINKLNDVTSDRNTKRRSLEKIQSETVGRSGIEPELARSLLSHLLKTILRCFSDPIERCRELAINLLLRFTKVVDDIIFALPYVLPVLSSRLAEPDIVEPSEELRLLLVDGTVQIIEKAGQRFEPGVEEAVRIVCHTLGDPFPDVKKAATVTKSLVSCLQHRHSAVRISALQAMQEVVLVDPAGLDDSLDALRLLTLDKSPLVRESLYTVAITWLTRLIDRYSLGYKILPLVYAGLTDELEKLRGLSATGMESLGVLYEKEWADRLKDEMDTFMGIGNINLSPDRHRVGARHLARDNTQKIVAKMVEGLVDWNPDIRCKSAAVLAVFIPFAEENITGYSGMILPALYRVLSSDEPFVMNQVSLLFDGTIKVAEALGRYVNPEVYITVLLNHITANTESTAFRLGCLRALSGLVSGTPPRVLEPYLLMILDGFSSGDLVGNESILVVLEVSHVTKILVQKVAAQQDVEAEVHRAAGYRIFTIIVSLLSFKGNDKVAGWVEMIHNAKSSLESLATAVGSAGTSGLYSLYFDAFIEDLRRSCGTWVSSSPELRAFATVLLESDGFLGSRLEPVFQIFAQCCGKDVEINLQKNALETLSKLFKSRISVLDSKGQLLSQVTFITDSIIVPTATWRPGGNDFKKVRGLSMKCLRLLLEGSFKRHDPSNALCREYLQHVMGDPESQCFVVTWNCFDEDDEKTRTNALEAMKLLLVTSVAVKVYFKAGTFKKLYEELLKRLDDTQDSVRILTCSVIKSFALAVGAFHSQALRDAPAKDSKEYVETRLDDGHWEVFLKGVLIHAEDPKPEVQNAAESAIAALIKVAPEEVVQKLRESKGRLNTFFGAAESSERGQAPVERACLQRALMSEVDNSTPTILDVVDLSPFLSADGGDATTKDASARKLIEAAERYGAFYVTGHDVDFQVPLNAARKFFDLPKDVKLAMSVKKGGFTRGYIGLGSESGGTALEVKEAFSYGYDWDATKPPTNPLQGPNIFPEKSILPQSWRDNLLGFYDENVRVSKAITRCLSHALGRDLSAFCEGGETISLMRMFRYFPYGTVDGEFRPEVDRIGSSEHSDWGFLTLIASDLPGLQICVADNRGGRTWETVQPVPGAFIVNAGDYLSLITQGRVASPLHRVATGTRERTSFVFFFYPAYESKIDPGQDTEAEGGAEAASLARLSLFKNQAVSGRSGDVKAIMERLKTMSFGEYIHEKWASVFRNGGYNG